MVNVTMWCVDAGFVHDVITRQQRAVEALARGSVQCLNYYYVTLFPPCLPVA